MATRRTTAKAAAPQPSAPLQPEDLARFLGLQPGGYKADKISAFLAGAIGAADAYIGEGAAAQAGNHLYKQGVLHLAAKLYTTGQAKPGNDEQLPTVCRYFFELVRRELSGSAE